MTKVFIVRPFGQKRPVLKKDPATGKYNAEEFNFDRVETELIRPAMNATNLIGGPTTDIFAADDIRQDMFSSLLLDDLVIADITVHNANVFYELGIRHALRDKRTILIKCAGYDETPFDIIGYRYVAYKKDDPASAKDDLIKAINETIDPQSTRKDSPVFNVLPSLEPQDPERYLAVPVDFGKELAMAKEARDLGWLTLLAKEAEAFAWKPTAFRQLGDAFFNAKDYATAKTLFEDILNTRPKDRQANERLATVYQRLAEIELTNNPALETPLLAQSDLAITYADFLCLTCQEPEKVAFRYQEIIDDINDLNKEAVIRQLLIYQDLEIQPENVAAALAVIARPPAAKTRYAFLFTGHMIDRADCAQPRFPAAKEPEIRQKIHDALSKAQAGLGPGGTADMVQAAKKIWNKVIPIQP